MVWHLFYKEWLKTRWFAIFSAVLAVSMVLYGLVELRSNVINSGGMATYLHNWLTMGGGSHWDGLENIPWFIALIIGIFQYFPEVINKRIKLTLHLPVSGTLLLYLMVLYGFLVLTAIYVVMLGVFFLFSTSMFPAEINAMAFSDIASWIGGGYVLYFFTAMIAMEPTWKFRFFYALALYIMISTLQSLAGEISGLWMVVILIVASLSMLYTSNRFKIGER